MWETLQVPAGSTGAAGGEGKGEFQEEGTKQGRRSQ